jgi:nicotinamidase-related amidase
MTQPGWEDRHSVSGSRAPGVALLLVDYQPAYYAGATRAAFPDLPAKVGRLLASARSRLRPAQIVHVRANYTHAFAQNFLRLNPDKPLPSDVDAEPWASGAVGERVVAKGSFDAFHGTDLDAHLRALGCERVVVCGLLTSVCVLFTAQAAFARGYRVTLYSPGCGDRDAGRHAAALQTYGNYIFDVAADIGDLPFP